MNPVVELELYLVRHGQSLMNIEDGYGVPKDMLTLSQRENPELSHEGHRQAQLLGESLEKVCFDAVLSSPLFRAAQTALEAVGRSNHSTRRIGIYSLLTECGVSHEYKGVSMNELNEKYGSIFFNVENDGEDALLIAHDKDETAQRERARRALKFIRNSFNNGERVLVVGHGEFNTELMLEILGIGIKRGFDPYFANTSVTKLIFYKTGTGPFGYDVRLCCVNNISHLNKNGQETYS